MHSPELRAAVPADHPDYLVPEYILYRLPIGLKGLLVAALLAAAMSSLDSALNSLSAVTMRDFLEPRLRNRGGMLLLASKLTTVAWGAAITGFAFFVGRISQTVIEAINKIGSAFYGPILAAFLCGILLRGVSLRGIVAGIFIGVGFNLSLWLFDAPVHWMWWNIFGFVASVAGALVFSLLWPPEKNGIEAYLLTGKRLVAAILGSKRMFWLLVAYFAMMLLVASSLQVLP